jgi:hypothetical protein
MERLSSSKGGWSISFDLKQGLMEEGVAVANPRHLQSLERLCDQAGFDVTISSGPRTLEEVER